MLAALLLALAAPSWACLEMASFGKLLREPLPRTEDKKVQEAVVLYDGVGPYDTGQCLQVLETKDGRHRVRRKGGKESWVEAHQVYLFPKDSDYGSFLRGYAITPYGLIEDNSPAAVLHSPAFLERALRSPIPAVRTYARVRELGLSEGKRAGAAWLALRGHPDRGVRSDADYALARKKDVSGDAAFYDALSEDAARRPLGELGDVLTIAEKSGHPGMAGLATALRARCEKELRPGDGVWAESVCKWPLQPGGPARAALSSANPAIRYLALEAVFTGDPAGEDLVYLEGRLDAEKDARTRERVFYILLRSWRDPGLRERLTIKAKTLPKPLREAVEYQIRSDDWAASPKPVGPPKDAKLRPTTTADLIPKP